MADFPISYDPASNTITLDGPGGATIMLGLLLKAKFGEAYDPLVLFHEPVAQLMVSLRERAALPPDRGCAPFAPEVLHAVAERILDESPHLNWWTLSDLEQRSYIRDVVAAPHAISDDEIEAILDGVQAGLARRRESVAAADKAKTP
jgi:hypothetical protein